MIETTIQAETFIKSIDSAKFLKVVDYAVGIEYYVEYKVRKKGLGCITKRQWADAVGIIKIAQRMSILYHSRSMNNLE